MTPRCQLGVSSCLFSFFPSLRQQSRWGVRAHCLHLVSICNETDQWGSLAHAKVNSPLLYTNTQNLSICAVLDTVHPCFTWRSLHLPACFAAELLHLSLVPRATTHRRVKQTRNRGIILMDEHLILSKSHLNGWLFKSVYSPTSQWA